MIIDTFLVWMPLLVIVNLVLITQNLEYGAKLCLSIGMLIPNLPCNLKLIEGEAVKVEKMIKQTQQESKNIKDAMYG